MYAVTGITGKVGGAVARALLGAGQPVRAVVRSAEKGLPWAQLGCEVTLAEVDDAQAMAQAFSGVDGVFIMLPSNFDPSPGFPEARVLVDNIRQALQCARPGKVVCLSTIGAQATQPNLLNQLQLLEQALGSLAMPVTFLRPGWFMENALWDVAPAIESGLIPSFLQPLDKPVPMIATADVGRVAAELLQEAWQGQRIVELEGAQRITPDQIAETFARLLDKPVSMQVVPRDRWQALFSEQGMRNPLPRMQMIDGFNEGWIEFAGTPRKGQVELETVLKGLLL
ncbi:MULTISPECIES: NmrA family NAD(P)-binding protein [unclassified Pseudomonas]|uniref:NmrA family NAD(P)-binding protein n=1 Tax=unclassified Pseudomonas TaxID=196821 RepID=UPI0012955300|nr:MULTISPECIES: NmrA family NAD(P)-binding protein [unclassified Pseudomonas]MQT44740.1 NAD(P)H-binding protein [Pseudomonas sp. FSL R10-0765]MQT55149.1 NAD(P)H-binding protein [Pseudomonas sp. FSL R10-2398]MQU03220.1 NAD(P)H-binding protein [Pseudomonas sp. FSL R10-2245]MQU13833.1 NAD(P)H-binding protein [Pseudomonas sp. FSL R10-2189]MQU40480.1 NAD(P)H-binding protein [Pseudomonas sp. FSL R10-2172]